MPHPRKLAPPGTPAYPYRHRGASMANDEHVAMLKQGVAAWNAWRDENRNVLHPNLYGADLHEADLPRANLNGADLNGADLTGANLGEGKIRTVCRDMRQH